ncbi:MAG: hypothetical protein ACE5L6_02205 [Candidatus Bathyarchaeia archaeon]
MIEQLLLIIIGVIIGSVLGVEYSLWRAGRKLDWIKDFVGFNEQHYNELPPPKRREYLGKLLKDVFNSLFPETPVIPPPPSKVVGFTNSFFIPQCPECGYAVSPVRAEPGTIVESHCPKHGVFRVTIPENKKEE